MRACQCGVDIMAYKKFALNIFSSLLNEALQRSPVICGRGYVIYSLFRLQIGCRHEYPRYEDAEDGLAMRVVDVVSRVTSHASSSLESTNPQHKLSTAGDCLYLAMSSTAACKAAAEVLDPREESPSVSDEFEKVPDLNIPVRPINSRHPRVTDDAPGPTRTVPRDTAEIPSTEEEADALYNQSLYRQITLLQQKLRTPKKRARDLDPDDEEVEASVNRGAREPDLGPVGYTRDLSVGPARPKRSQWSTVTLADPSSLGRGCEIPHILVKTLARMVFVPLADFVPSVLAAASSGSTPIPTKRIKLEDDLFETDVVNSGDIWARDANLNKGEWIDAYNNFFRALQHPTVGMTEEQVLFFVKLRDFLLDHEYAIDGTHWSIVAKTDLRARQAFFAFPRQFNSAWVVNLIQREYMQALVQTSTQHLLHTPPMPQPSIHSSPVASNNRIRRHISHTLPPPLPNPHPGIVTMPFRSSTGARPGRCWICKGTHQASACSSTAVHHARYDPARGGVIRATDGARFCGDFNRRGACSRPQCQYLHECITCSNGAHGASQAVC